MQRFRLEYGWTTFWLVALLVFTATWSVQQAEWADGLHILTPVTILGLAVGLVLAQMRQIPAVMAHISAFAIGVVVVFFQMTTFLSDDLGSRSQKLSWLWGRWESWFATIRHGESAEDLYLFILLMCGMLWVLSYAAVWFVFRSSWIWITLLLPGVIVLLNLGYSSHVPTFILIVYLFAAFLLLMRFNFIEREKRWRREGVPYPNSLLVRGFWTASYLAVILILAGWLVPFSPRTDRVVAAWNNLDRPIERIETAFTDRFGNVLPGSGGGSGGLGGFASFDSEFDLGGSLTLSEEPVVFVQGSEAPYLVAHRYDFFNGEGWETTIDETYDSDSEEGSTPPLVSFDAEQTIPVPATSRQATRERTHQIEVLRPQGSIVLSGGETVSANIETQLQTAWYTYDNQEIRIENAEQGNTPPDLWNLVTLLKDADFTPVREQTPTVEQQDGGGVQATPTATATSTPTPESTGTETEDDNNSIDPELLSDDARENYENVREAQRELAERDIETELVLADDYTVESLIFSGPLPVFNDVEAIYAPEISTGDTYEITSLVSEATEEQLRAASTVYPTELTRRYLQVPEDSSPRVEELARQLTSNAENPYDKAKAIETWLRENLEYNEQISRPPEGADFIEHFIFESQEGYCTYYATSMAQMLRMVDVPARVAVGFFPAAYDEDVGGAVYRDSNAHAWVEVYFPQYGWVSFEPTPARSTISRGSPEGDASASAALGEMGPGEVPREEAWMYPEEEFAPGAAGGSGLQTGAQDTTSTAQWIMRGVAALLLIAVGIVSYMWLRGLGGLSPAGQFYTRLERGAAWTGIRAESSMTPFEYARSIASNVPGSRTDAEYLADLYVRERYGNQRLAAPEITRARAAWLRLRGMFVKYALFRRLRRDSSRDE